MPLNFSRELDIDSFREFAAENARYAYMQGLKATHEKRRARELAVKSLFGVLKNKQHFEAEKKEISEEKAVDLVLRSFLISDERKRLDTDDDKFEVTPPSDSEQADIVEKAYNKALSAQPTLAPLYSGTRSGLVLVFVAAVICLAIFFIWRDPLGLLGSADIDGEKTAKIDTTAIPSSGNFIDIDFDAMTRSGQNIPVRITLSGPDMDNVVSVEYADDRSDSFSEAYRCGDNEWVMVASSQGYYKVNVKGNNGLDVTKFFRLKQKVSRPPEVDVSSITVNEDKTAVNALVQVTTDNLPVSFGNVNEALENDDGTYSISVPYGVSTVVRVMDCDGNETGFAFTEDAKLIMAPQAKVSAIQMGHDSEKTLNISDIFGSSISYCTVSVSGSDISAILNDDSTISLKAGNGFTGVNMLTLNGSDDFGMNCTANLPVIAVNSRPYCDESSELSAKIKHTPSNQGNFIGNLIAIDKENDPLVYTLDSQDGCNVTLAQNGSFVLFVDPSFSGKRCSFDFSVSDGILKSGPYKYNIDLENTILSGTAYSQSFICYGGKDGWYEVNLPTTDNDGDVLSWNVVSPLVSGCTEKGNFIDHTNGYSKLLLKVNPQLNENFTEKLELTCTDGWLTSDTVTLNCTFRQNKAPRAGASNSSTVPLSSSAETFTLDITDDCPFDKCIISEVIESRGGLVIDRDGWNELKFTMSFDDHGDVLDNGNVRAFAILRVKDIVTGQTVDVRYSITRAA